MVLKYISKRNVEVLKRHLRTTRKLRRETQERHYKGCKRLIYHHKMDEFFLHEIWFEAFTFLAHLVLHRHRPLNWNCRLNRRSCHFPFSFCVFSLVFSSLKLEIWFPKLFWLPPLAPRPSLQKAMGKKHLKKTMIRQVIVIV